MLSDNPMQSELACIVGLAGKFFVDAVGWKGMIWSVLHWPMDPCGVLVKYQDSMWTPQGLGKDWNRTGGGLNVELPAKWATFQSTSSPPPVHSTWSGPCVVSRKIRSPCHEVLVESWWSPDGMCRVVLTEFNFKKECTTRNQTHDIEYRLSCEHPHLTVRPNSHGNSCNLGNYDMWIGHVQFERLLNQK